MKLIVYSILILATVAGCATYRPVIDTRGINLNEYEIDLKECQDFARQIDPAAEMAAGAAGGALIGALIGAAVGGRSMSGYGAKVGAANGIGAGAATGLAGQIQIVRNCIAGRGYRVLR